MLTKTSVSTGYATEEGHCGIQFSCFDTDGTTAVTPLDGVVWSLTDGAGSTINSRDNVAVTAGETMLVELSGDDLALPEAEISSRYLTLTGEYSSITLGAHTKFVHQHKFYIKPVVKPTIWP